MTTLKQNILNRITHVKQIANDAVLQKEIIKIPKYEFHVHLAGAMRRQTLYELAQKNNVPLMADKNEFLSSPSLLLLSTGQELWELFHHAYKWCWSCVKTLEDLERVVFELIEDQARQGVIHSEITVSGTYLTNQFSFNEWTSALYSGIQRAEFKYPIKAGIIFDISRRSGPEQALKNVENILINKPKAICGIGMGGDEVKYPYKLYLEAFNLAKKNRIPATIHIAEFNPGETTIDAIKYIQPNRFGHALNNISARYLLRVSFFVSVLSFNSLNETVKLRLNVLSLC